MAGDYLFQSQRMAALKLTDWRVRLRHVAVYTSCFGIVTLLGYGTLVCSILFLMWIAVNHFLTDSKRWRTDNPWPPMPIMVDQSMHMLQIAVGSIILLSPGVGDAAGDAAWWIVDFTGIFGS